MIGLILWSYNLNILTKNIIVFSLISKKHINWFG
jgi:hypothetical protein